MPSGCAGASLCSSQGLRATGAFLLPALSATRQVLRFGGCCGVREGPVWRGLGQPVRAGRSPWVPRRGSEAGGPPPAERARSGSVEAPLCPGLGRPEGRGRWRLPGLGAARGPSRLSPAVPAAPRPPEARLLLSAPRPREPRFEPPVRGGGAWESPDIPYVKRLFKIG